MPVLFVCFSSFVTRVLFNWTSFVWGADTLSSFNDACTWILPWCHLKRLVLNLAAGSGGLFIIRWQQKTGEVSCVPSSAFQLPQRWRISFAKTWINKPPHFTFSAQHKAVGVEGGGEEERFVYWLMTEIKNFHFRSTRPNAKNKNCLPCGVEPTK